MARKRTGFPLIATLAALALANVSLASESVMRFETLSVADGLSQSSVMAIAQDELGFMWFATESGLDRFDGQSFRHYRHERGNAGALPSDFARDLHIAADGSLWVATDGGGLSRWDPASDSFTTWRHDPANPETLATDRIRTVVTDSTGTAWIGTRASGLNRLDPATGRVTRYEHDPDNLNTLADNDIYAIAIAPDGAVWVGTRYGIDRLDPESGDVQRFNGTSNDDATVHNNHVRSLLFDARGNLWIGTHSKGLCRLDPETLTVTHNEHDADNPASIASNRVNVVFEDDSGRIWAGTDRGLSLKLPDGTFASFANDEKDVTSLGGDSIFSIYQDRGGVFWVGTRTGGVSKWNPRSWSFGHVKPDFGTTNVTAFAERDNGNLWVGTFGGGVSVVDSDNQLVRTLANSEDGSGLSDNRVMSLLTDRDGRVWAGTMRGGLNRIDPASDRVTTFRNNPEDPASLAANGVMSLHEDRDGRIWVGTFGGGVSVFDRATGRFEQHAHDASVEGSLSSPRATSIAENATATIFVGTDGGGLNIRDKSGDRWETLRHDRDDPTSIKSDTIYALHVDAADRIWVGTRAGLDLVVRADTLPLRYELVAAGSHNLLPRTAIFGIESDSAGRLWLSTSNGLISYDPASGRSREFHENQGLQGEEFNFGASFRRADGTIYFGGSNGYNAFRPEQLEFATMPPPVVLTSLSILNEAVDTPVPYERLEALDLGFQEDVITFGVAALDFGAPEKNRFAYRLEGFDDQWIDLGADGRITYTNLDGGQYTLRVRAANSDGTWNDAGLSIPVSVEYPPWKTWWAYLLYVLAVGLSIYAFWRRQQNRLRQEYEYSRRLEREVSDRTKQLAARNEDLKTANEKLLEASTTDALTGLRNRRFLFEQIGKDVDLVLRHYRDGTETMSPAGNNDLLFLMVDLDNFKPVNDTCGHEAGDELLIQIRDVLLDACRSSDDVIRWGGDEFLIVARETNRSYAATLAERIRSGLAQRVFPVGNGQVARVTTSIGYATFPFLKDQPELLTWEEVLGVADAAMYEAKQKRNAWVGIEGLDWPDSGAELCRAIKEDPGQLAADGLIRAVESVEDAAEASA